MNRDSFIFYGSFLDAINKIKNKDVQGKLALAILEYGITGETSEYDEIVDLAMTLIKPQIDANYQRYLNGKKGGAHGTKGGRPRGNEKPQENPKETPKKPQENPKETPNENVDVDVDENVDEDSLKKSSNEDKKETKKNDDFEIFRKAYPAANKGGYKKTFENFKKKHKDWKQAIPLLLPALENEKYWRELAAENGKVFIPEWAGIGKWLNERRWEQEFNFNFNNKPESEEFKRFKERYKNVANILHSFTQDEYKILIEEYTEVCKSIIEKMDNMDLKHVVNAFLTFKKIYNEQIN